MENDSEIIELKFEGNGIKPSKVKASEIADLIRSLEDSIMSIVRSNHPELDEDYVLISFEEIKESSLSLKCRAHKAASYVIPAYMAITASFEQHNFNNLPKTSIEALRTITRFSKRHDCDGAFIRNDHRLATFNPKTEVAYRATDLIKGETTIYGEVKKAGGEVPRVTLRINGEYSIHFEVKKEIAIQLASQLYKEVGLIGTATWDRNTYRVLDFKAKGVVNLETPTLKDTFTGLYGLLGDHLDRIEDFNSYKS